MFMVLWAAKDVRTYSQSSLKALGSSLHDLNLYGGNTNPGNDGHKCQDNGGGAHNLWACNERATAWISK